MKRTSFKEWQCSIAQSVEQIGDAWTLLVLRNAFCGMRRFEDFRDGLNVASNILSDRLRHLTDVGILQKVPDPNDGRRVEYRLTDKGMELYPLLVFLLQWGDKWMPTEEGTRMTLVDRHTGQQLAPIRVTNMGGTEIQATDVSMEPGPGIDDRHHQLATRKR